MNTVRVTDEKIKTKDTLELGRLTRNEIKEIPDSIRRTIVNKEDRQNIKNTAQAILDSGCVSIYCLGSGTSYHAGLVSTYWFSQLAKYPTHCELAPEFPFLVEPIIAKKHCCICISQSGESELTVYSAQKAKEKGSLVITITNNKDSSLAKIADHALFLKAGPEKSVLATKTYVTELVLLTALAVELAFLRGMITDEIYEQYWDELKSMPKLIELILPTYESEIRKIAPYFKFARQCFVIGAGPDYANCMEAALKLKEGARIFSQAFSTAEFPHGPITLADPVACFVVCLIPRKEAESRHHDVIKLISRLKERGITVLGIKNPLDSVPDLDITIEIPQCSEIFHPIFDIIPIQLLVVEISTIQGINCDEPKFLSKISKL